MSPLAGALLLFLAAPGLALPRQGGNGGPDPGANVTDPAPPANVPSSPAPGSDASTGEGSPVIRDHRNSGESVGTGAPLAPAGAGTLPRGGAAARRPGAAESGADALALKAALNLQLGDAPTACRFAREALKLDQAHRKALDIERLACRQETPGPRPTDAPPPRPRDAGSSAPEASTVKPLAEPPAGGLIAQAPAPAQTRRALAASAALARNEDKEALAIAEEGLAESPKDPSLLLVKSIALHKLKLPDSALDILEKLLARGEGDAQTRADAHALLSLILAEKGEIERAKQELRQAAGLDPRAYEDVLRQALRANLLSLFGKQVKLKPGAEGPGALTWVLGSAGAGFLVMVLLALALRAAGRRSAAAATAPASAPPLGEGVLVAGQYRVSGELGRGGMGVVYGGVDEKLQRKVALKQLQSQLRESDEDLERFLKEARLVAQLRHPNLAAIYNVVEHGEDVLLVFEHVEGATLSKALLSGASLTTEQAQRVLEQIASALEHAHSQRIIHRDLKPSNVMIGADGAVKVMDFGIAHQASGAGATSTAASGTLPYMAPEQAMGSVSTASDLYALGVMTYEMLCGKLPFEGPDYLGPKLHKQFMPITRRRILPAGLDAFFDAVLDPDPGARPASAAAFVDAYRKALS